MEGKLGPKIQNLKNFLTDLNSEESQNYINDLISKETVRPEELFVGKFLNAEFWKEVGFSDKEIKIEGRAGVKGRVEIGLHIEDRKIAVECKKPYYLKNGEAVRNELDGNDIFELEDQISQYLLSHHFVIFTNGFHWFFYSQESYAIWQSNKNKKDNQINPYFDHFTEKEIFDQNSNYFIFNILSRQNILESLASMGNKSVKNAITDEFFIDLKNWAGFINFVLKDTPSNTKARTTSLINKFIFVRTMEGVGVIPNGFLASLWDNKKGVRNSPVDFIDHIDDELSEIYDTELFTPKFIVDEDGKDILKNELPQYSEERKKNYAYVALPEEFLSAILKPVDALNFDSYGKTKIRFKDQDFYIRSLYWWKFESISADILGKAYETYLAKERKKLGIYYTTHQITEYLTHSTIDNIFQKKILDLKDELEKEDWDVDKIKNIAKKIYDIKICDPSCGSGSFLIQAIRRIWKKYQELELIIGKKDNELTKGKSTLDVHFTDKISVLRFLQILFRIDDKQQRMGTMILRHIFGNDKDVNAIDTAKLNVWLECLRLDANSYRREKVKGKRHVLPNLGLNLTVGDSLIDLSPEEVDASLNEESRGTLQSIFKLRNLYVESFDKTSIANDAAKLRDGLKEYFLRDKFKEKIPSKLYEKLQNLTDPLYWPLLHFSAFYNEDGILKSENERGFDIIIGNPPWEILKPDVDEFFSPFYNSDEKKKFSKLDKKEKKKTVKDLLENNSISNQWKKYKEDIKTFVDYFKDYDYKHQFGLVDGKKITGDRNLYKLFLEKAYYLLKNDGMCGIVIPSNFYSDLGVKGLRELHFKKCKIISIYSFDNKNKIFEDLHRQWKFMTFVYKKGGKSSKFNAAFYVRDLDDLLNLDKNCVKYDLSLMEKTSPIAFSIIECGSKLEIELIKKLFSFPLLLDKSNWNVKLTREFDMTNDSDIFNEDEKGGVLYEGKMIHQFDSQLSPPRYWIKNELAENNLKDNILKKLQTNDNSNINSSKIKFDHSEYRLGWRSIGRATDKRAFIGTILPKNVYLGNSIISVKPYVIENNKIVKSLSLEETLYLCGFVNSFVVDFILRKRIAANINMFYVYELPIPKLSENDKLFKEIVQKTSQLVCINSEFDELKDKAKISKGVSEPKKRLELIAQINALVASIYNISKEDFELILDTFPQEDKELKEKTVIEFENRKNKNY